MQERFCVAGREIKVVRAMITNPADEILLVQRSENSHNNPGLWELPGGKVDRGETLEEACLREVHEETGLDISLTTDVRPVDGYEITNGRRRGQRYRAFCVGATVVGGELLPGLEHPAAAWHPVEVIRHENLTHISKKALSLMAALAFNASSQRPNR